MKLLLTICAVITLLLAVSDLAQADTHYVDPGGSNTPPYTTLATAAHSIQGAIDVAVSGSTVIVEAGNYNENLTVNKANLTLQSTSTAGTTLTANSGIVIDLDGGADGFTLGGMDGKGFTINSQAGTTRLVQLKFGPQDVEISWNELDTTGNASMGINVGASGTSGLNINNNTFIAEEGDGSIWGDVFGLNTTVSNNTFTGPGGLVGGYAIQFKAATGASTITGNNITGYYWGVGVLTGGGGTSGLTISDNSISNCINGIGLAQYQTGDITTVDITGNTLSNNTTGIKIGTAGQTLTNITVQENTVIGNNTGVQVCASAGGVVVNNNNISGNTTGVDNTDAGNTLDATANWWGDGSGPYHPTEWFYEVFLPITNPSGLGNEVSDYVLYLPWTGMGGFVTGGGNIWSEAGDYELDPEAEGQANFGFAAKYKKGANVPDGNTNFVFSTANFHFHSSDYDWLIVAGDTAKFKGTGTIEGLGDGYKFMLWAGDNDPDVDTFRILIWEGTEEDPEVLVYDNGPNDLITGGNIIIHKEKGKN